MPSNPNHESALSRTWALKRKVGSYASTFAAKLLPLRLAMATVSGARRQRGDGSSELEWIGFVVLHGRWGNPQPMSPWSPTRDKRSEPGPSPRI